MYIFLPELERWSYDRQVSIKCYYYYYYYYHHYYYKYQSISQFICEKHQHYKEEQFTLESINGTCIDSIAR